MKKIFTGIMIIVVLMVSPQLVFAKAKTIQLRVAASKDEMKTVPNQKYSYVAHNGETPKDIYVSKDVVISNGDIQSMMAVSKEGIVVIHITLTAEGTKKLTDVTAKETRKRLAVVIDNEVLTAPMILFSIKNGQFAISHWSINTAESAKKFITDLGFTPSLQSDSAKK